MKCEECKLWTPPASGKAWGKCGLQFPVFVETYLDDETRADHGCSFGQPKEKS